MKKPAKTEASIQAQNRQPDGAGSAGIQPIAEHSQRRHTAPGAVNLCSRPGEREIWILSEVLRVVREVQERRCGVQGEQPAKALTAAGSAAGGHERQTAARYASSS